MPFPNVNDAAAAETALGKIFLGILAEWVGLGVVVGATVWNVALAEVGLAIRLVHGT